VSTVTYFNDPQCNNFSGVDDEWVINENVIFSYPASVKLLESVDNSSLHMSLHKPSIPSTFVECVEGAVFMVPHPKGVNHR